MEIVKTLIYILFILIVIILLYHYKTNNIVGYWRQNSDGCIYHIEKVSYRKFKINDIIGNITQFNQINYKKDKGYICGISIIWNSGEMWDYQFSK